MEFWNVIVQSNTFNFLIFIGLFALLFKKINFGAMMDSLQAKVMVLIEDAKRVEEAGAFSVVLECVPAALAKIITETISIPTIGIGAGAGCDGQILVYQDMLGMYSDFTPKFVKKFANVGQVMTQAFADYIKETKEGTFPTVEQSFKIDEEIIEKLK